MTDAFRVHARCLRGGVTGTSRQRLDLNQKTPHRSSANFNSFQVSSTKPRSAVWTQLIIPREQKQARFAEARRHFFWNIWSGPNCAFLITSHPKLSANKTHSNRLRPRKVSVRIYSNLSSLFRSAAKRSRSCCIPLQLLKITGLDHLLSFSEFRVLTCQSYLSETLSNGL